MEEQVLDSLIPWTCLRLKPLCEAIVQVFTESNVFECSREQSAVANVGAKASWGAHFVPAARRQQSAQRTQAPSPPSLPGNPA